MEAHAEIKDTGSLRAKGRQDAASVCPGNGPRAEADGQPLGVSSGVVCALTPSLNGAYQPPPAGSLSAAGVAKALPGIFAFCDK